MPQEQTTYTLHLPERIDSQNAAAYEEELIRLTGEHPGKVPVFDATDLTYISSAGLRVLLAAQKIMSKQGEMKLIHVNEIIMEIFEVTGFSDILTIE